MVSPHEISVFCSPIKGAIWVSISRVFRGWFIASRREDNADIFDNMSRRPNKRNAARLLIASPQ